MLIQFWFQFDPQIATCVPESSCTLPPSGVPFERLRPPPFMDSEVYELIQRGWWNQKNTGLSALIMVGVVRARASHERLEGVGCCFPSDKFKWSLQSAGRHKGIGQRLASGFSRSGWDIIFATRSFGSECVLFKGKAPSKRWTNKPETATCLFEPRSSTLRRLQGEVLAWAKGKPREV